MEPMDVDAPATTTTRVLRPYRVVLADIEGTTTDIAFVHNELFPYARAHLPAYVRQHANEPAVQAILRDLHTQSLADAQAAKQPNPSPIYADFAPVTSPSDLDSVIAHLQWLMRHDVKRGPLKSLQGLVWAAAYASRAVQGHIYPDVVPALLAWRHLDVPVYIYSSGSVPAQKLLFGHSTYGDLQPYFADYFDTAVGAKVAPQSYAAIFNRLNADFAKRNLVPLAPSDILFLSDNGAELVAARRIGIQAVLVVRENNPVVTEDAKRQFPSVAAFGELFAPHVFNVLDKQRPNTPMDAVDAGLTSAAAVAAAAPGLGMPAAPVVVVGKETEVPVLTKRQRKALAREQEQKLQEQKQQAKQQQQQEQTQTQQAQQPKKQQQPPQQPPQQPKQQQPTPKQHPKQQQPKPQQPQNQKKQNQQQHQQPAQKPQSQQQQQQQQTKQQSLSPQPPALQPAAVSDAAPPAMPITPVVSSPSANAAAAAPTAPETDAIKQGKRRSQRGKQATADTASLTANGVTPSAPAPTPAAEDVAIKSEPTTPAAEPAAAKSVAVPAAAAEPATPALAPATAAPAPSATPVPANAAAANQAPPAKAVPKPAAATPKQQPKPKPAAATPRATPAKRKREQQPGTPADNAKGSGAPGRSTPMATRSKRAKVNE
ncbi:hypothetical protein GGF31_001506 [Allomyces arbusculus]|nr:hypothetical protein GGF31_001506 [Allomyces arbusculus]